MATPTVLSIVKMILGIFLLFPSVVFSAEYYVDGNNGNDANDGSEATPWKTIGRALNPPLPHWILPETNTLYILSGTYNELVFLNPGPLHSLNITGISRDGEMPIIDAANINALHAIQVLDYSGTIQGLEITGAVLNGIDIGGNSLEATVINCTIYGNNKGIHVNTTSTPLLQGNTIYDNNECGIGNMGEASATISGNQIYQNGNGNSAGPSAGICVAQNSSPTIVNNIVRNNNPSGINILDSAHPVISNNIIAHHQDDILGTGIKVVHTVGIAAVTISNNILYDNDYALYSQEEREVSGNSFNSFWQNSINYFGFTTGSHDIFTDPLLTTDYNVAAGSPCIDSGTALNAPAKDINGASRPSGMGFDRGVYEYQERKQGAVCISSVLSLLLSK